MNLLFMSETDNAADWESALKKELPGMNFLVWPDETEPREQINYALVWKPSPGELRKYTNLKAILSLGAGVDGVLNDPDLPSHVPIIRLVDPYLTMGMNEYIIYWTLFHHRRMDDYSNLIKKGQWKHFPQPNTYTKKVGILGAGELGAEAARMLTTLKFDVATWSKNPKTIEKVTCFTDDAGFEKLLKRSDILICLLPLTKDTTGILNRQVFYKMPKGSIVINCARGGHVIDSHLIEAIESGQIKAATLDVFNEEPLPNSHPFWNCRNIFLTPHMASLTIPKSAAKSISNSISLIESGQMPPNIIDLKKGY